MTNTTSRAPRTDAATLPYGGVDIGFGAQPVVYASVARSLESELLALQEKLAQVERDAATYLAEKQGLQAVVDCCYDELKTPIGREVECPAYIPDAIRELATSLAQAREALEKDRKDAATAKKDKA